MSSATLNVLLALVAFGILHSLTAAIGIKALFAGLFGARAYLGLYRLFYNFGSVITFLPVLILVGMQSGEMVWQVRGIAAVPMLVLQGIGLIGLVISVLQIDGLRFLGISQAQAWMMGEKLPLPDELLSVGGVYALTRHPLYFFSLLFLWFTPSLSEAMLGLNLGATLYFALGSLLEEQKLLHAFGEDYAAYRAKVAWMIPFIRLPRF